MVIMFYLLIQGIVNFVSNKEKHFKPLLTSSIKKEALLFVLFVLILMLDFIQNIDG